MTGMVMVTRGGGCAGKSSKSAAAEEHEKQQLREEQQQLSVIDFILSALRKSMVSTCRIERQDQEGITAVHHMEFGWPTNVQHITHVTFDRPVCISNKNPSMSSIGTADYAAQFSISSKLKNRVRTLTEAEERRVDSPEAWS